MGRLKANSNADFIFGRPPAPSQSRSPAESIYGIRGRCAMVADARETRSPPLVKVPHVKRMGARRTCENVSYRKTREEIGGDDGARTYLSYRQLQAGSGMYLTLRAFDLAFRQPEATAFPGMLAPC